MHQQLSEVMDFLYDRRGQVDLGQRCTFCELKVEIGSPLAREANSARIKMRTPLKSPRSTSLQSGGVIKKQSNNNTTRRTQLRKNIMTKSE